MTGSSRGRTAWRTRVALYVAGAVVLLGLSLPGPALAATPRASLPDIEDEVMCLECGTALSLSNAAVADRERQFIRREIAQGKTKQQIKDDLVARFGPAVLALPEDKGFGLAAYIVPVLVALLALAGLALVAVRWRRPATTAAAPVDLDPSDERRLERELTEYDGEVTSTRR